MKPKRKGPKYRNLTARGGVIYYQRRIAAPETAVGTQAAPA